MELSFIILLGGRIKQTNKQKKKKQVFLSQFSSSLTTGVESYAVYGIKE